MDDTRVPNGTVRLQQYRQAMSTRWGWSPLNKDGATRRSREDTERRRAADRKSQPPMLGTVARALGEI